MYKLTVEEIYELLASASVIALAFYIASLPNLHSFNIFVYLLLFLIVILSFIPHELAHRYVAIKNGFYARYKMWPFGLLLALLFSFFGFVFAAPGAVYIIPTGFSKFENEWKIALAGPLANILVALLFSFIFFVSKSLGISLLSAICIPIIKINVFLALFNSLPIPPLDGSKIAFQRLDIYVPWFIFVCGMYMMTWLL